MLAQVLVFIQVCTVTSLTKCFQLRLKKEAKKNISLFIVARIYGFVLRIKWIFSFKEWNSDENQQDKLLLWGYLFHYVIFIYNSPGTLFLQLSHTVWNLTSYGLCSSYTFLCGKHPLSSGKSRGQPAFIIRFFKNLLYKGYCRKGINKTLMTCASNLKQQEHTHSSSSVSISARDCSNMSTSVHYVV